ncbi:hypothetical protein NDU88_008901 [Pleurodeles waltl]|uniref:Uncharacterized protein n=1 Tax=Pleurodeles waltl TaxID=8319 RepID=A0AAV7QPY4_PLEWA|nr:hypothetical protein NDU88_008901 [Pleurodeles waltl]
MCVLDGGGLQCPRSSPSKKRLPGRPAHFWEPAPKAQPQSRAAAGNTTKRKRGPRFDTTAGQAPQRTSVGAIPGALQVSPGTAQSGPVSSVAGESTPRHEEADFTFCAADQPPPL